MNKILFSIYRILVPKPLRTIILKKNLRKKILQYFASLPEGEVNDEQREVLKYLENNTVTIFPYPFYNNYSPELIEVFYDHGNGMHYVFLDGKRLYFRKGWSKKRIQRAFADLTREQDVNSPHRYLSDNFTVNNDDIIADIGAAEGNFSLSVIDKIKKTYLFESDYRWIEALKATFAPYSAKVEIINKRVADYDDKNNIRFDTFYNTRRGITILKIDVDGAEKSVLSSCRAILSGKVQLKIALCTYHKNNDEEDFTMLLKDYGFKISYSKGYMIHYYDKKIKAPWLRRGLIRAVK